MPRSDVLARSASLRAYSLSAFFCLTGGRLSSASAEAASPAGASCCGKVKRASVNSAERAGRWEEAPTEWEMSSIMESSADGLNGGRSSSCLLAAVGARE